MSQSRGNYSKGFVEIMKTQAIKDTFNEFRLTNDGDDWGTVMQWWFATSEITLFERNLEVPSEWRFKPSPFGMTSEEDSLEVESLRRLDDDDLIYFGKILFRYAGILKAKGKDY